MRFEGGEEVVDAQSRARETDSNVHCSSYLPSAPRQTNACSPIQPLLLFSFNRCISFWRRRIFVSFFHPYHGQPIYFLFNVISSQACAITQVWKKQFFASSIFSPPLHAREHLDHPTSHSNTFSAATSPFVKLPPPLFTSFRFYNGLLLPKQILVWKLPLLSILALESVK